MSAAPPNRVDVVVVGAGFAGLRSLHTLRGLGVSVAVLEAGSGIGGVWHWNRYPGCRCDVRSYDYSYSFSEALEQEWRWSERYASQPEILRYVHHVADRFDLHRDIHLDTRVTDAVFDSDRGRWRVVTDGGPGWEARFFVMAVGQLSMPKAPELPGQDTFAGEIYHGAQWPHEPVDFSGMRVGIIGTGSTGMQMLPVVAPEAAHTTVFQRTPNFSIPACNAPIGDAEDANAKAHYRERRENARNSPSGLGFVPGRESALDVTAAERQERYEEAWLNAGFGFMLTFYDLILDRRANDTASDFIRGKLTEAVDDPDTAAALMPRDFPFGAKRPSVDSGYFEAFNRDDVALVDIRSHPIVALCEAGVVTTDGTHPLDVVVFATGFDALTGALLRPNIVGRGGRTLREKWSAGPLTYLGLGVEGFPNMFILAGPGSPSLLSNVLLSIEQHVDWVAALLRHMQAEGLEEVEATAEAEQMWVTPVGEKAAQTLYPSTTSYYNGDEVTGKPRVFMPYSGGVRGYRRILERVVDDGYDGFELRRLSDDRRAAAGQAAR